MEVPACPSIAIAASAAEDRAPSLEVGGRQAEAHTEEMDTEASGNTWSLQYKFTVHSMGGVTVELPLLLARVPVKDLALSVRKHFGIPLCSMKLLKGGEILTDLTLPLIDVFGSNDADVIDIDIMVVRRQLGETEQAELDAGLVRSAAGGATEEVEEYLLEGAQVNPEKNPCGGLSALMVAIAAGDGALCEKLREAGAAEPDMVAKTDSMQMAFAADFAQGGFVEVVRRIYAGDDVNSRLTRGQGIQATSSGVPLHACCALHRHEGSTELAHLLIRKGADLASGDAEGDTPLAHAKYFRADDIYRVLEGNGAKLGGPFFVSRRFFGRD